MKYVKEISSALDFLSVCVDQRDDMFITSSFGYQSALLFFLLSELGIKPNCLSITSDLSVGGIDRQRDYLVSRFDIELTEVDRNDWLSNELKGDHFFDLDEQRRRRICRHLKRIPLLDYIETNQFQMWISGIRRDQTDSRQRLKGVDVTDLGVIKVSPLANWSDEAVEQIIDDCGLLRNYEYVDLCKENSLRECGLHT